MATKGLQVSHLEDYDKIYGWMDEYDSQVVEQLDKAFLIVDKYRVRGRERILIDSIMVDLGKYFDA